MKIQLKRVSYSKYDEFVDTFSHNLKSNAVWANRPEKYEDCLEPILVSGQIVEVDLDAQAYLEVLDRIKKTNKQNPKASMDVEFAKRLYKALSLDHPEIPSNVFYEREVWTYLNCFVLYDLVVARYFDGSLPNSEQGEARIKRYFCSFGESKLDRTGLRWLWALADASYDRDHQSFALLTTAMEFIDPVKAIYECVIGTSRVVFQSFIQAIRLCENNPAIRSNAIRSILPTHIRSLATSKIYESYASVDELAPILKNDFEQFLKSRSSKQTA